MVRRRKQNKVRVCVGLLFVLILFSVLGFSVYSISLFFLEREYSESGGKYEQIDNTTIPVPEPFSQEKVTSLSLVMVGDALIHGSVYADAYKDGVYDFKPMLDKIKSITEKYDLAFYNQETILGGSELGVSTYPRFNSPYEVGDAFIDAGFNMVSLANNHTLDRGVDAIVNSRNYWNSKDVLVSGSATSMEERNNIQIKEKNGITYAMIAYTTYTNGLSAKSLEHVNIYSEEQIKSDIESIKNKVDVMIVSMHWGEEYTVNPTQTQREQANFLSTLGVDIIIGHHPHVIQPIEYVGETLVVYSLGNFISAQVGMDRLTGLMVSLTIEKSVKGNEVTISYTDPSAELIYTYSKSSNGQRFGFKVYPYSIIDDNILPNYKTYYDKYMSIVTSKSGRIKAVPLHQEG